jgi:NitT/TauT family transport system substrate-binding protein
MRQRPLLRVLALVFGAIFLFAACTGGGASTAPSTAASNAPAASTGASAAPSLAGTKTFSVGFTSLGLSSVAFLAALDDLRGQGYTIEAPEVAQSNLLVEGVAAGQFAFSSGTTLSFLLAAQKGSPVTIIGNRVGNEWTVTAKNAIADCAGLAGQRMAHHSESAVGTFMARNWIKETCSGTQPDELILAGSDNRANALKANQIDATELELSDAISVLTTDGDKFHILTNFSETLPQLKPSTIVGNSEFLKANPGTAVALLTAITAQNRKIAADATGGYLKSLAVKYLKNVNAATIDAVTKKYVELKLFETNGGINTESLTYTIKFFTDAGALTAGLTPEKAGDLSYLEKALASLGG